MSRLLIFPLLFLLAISGCAVGPDYERPELRAPIPDEWTEHANSPSLNAALPDSNSDHWLWWTAFGDSTLNELVAEALAYNDDLATAAARVLEARALYGGARSTRWPTFEVGGTVARSKVSLPATQFPVSPYNNFFDVNGTLRYEADLWGKLSRGRESALATLIASEQDRRAVAQQLIAQVVRTWLAVQELELQVVLTTQTITSFQESLTTVQDRYQRGLVPALDVHLASQNLVTAQAAKPAFQENLSVARRALEILVGRFPDGRILVSDGGPPTVMPTPLPPVPAGLPADLLNRRPDLQAAEMRLHAAVARIGESKAALYPRINLTATGGTKSLELSELATPSTNVWSLAANLFMPLLNRGATQAQIKAATARAEQAVAIYRKAVLTAFAEVGDALDRDFFESRQEVLLTESAQHARRAVSLAQDRYRRGLDNLLVTLESQRRLFTAESRLLTTQRIRRTARIDLIQALGGPWESPSAEGAQP